MLPRSKEPSSLVSGPCSGKGLDFVEVVGSPKNALKLKHWLSIPVRRGGPWWT